MLLPSLLHISRKEHEIFPHLYLKYELLSQCWPDSLTPVRSSGEGTVMANWSFQLTIYAEKTLAVSQCVILNYVIIAGFLSVNVWGMIQIKTSMLCLKSWHQMKHLRVLMGLQSSCLTEVPAAWSSVFRQNQVRTCPPAIDRKGERNSTSSHGFSLLICGRIIS